MRRSFNRTHGNQGDYFQRFNLNFELDSRMCASDLHFSCINTYLFFWPLQFALFYLPQIINNAGSSHIEVGGPVFGEEQQRQVRAVQRLRAHVAPQRQPGGKQQNCYGMCFYSKL